MAASKALARINVHAPGAAMLRQAIRECAADQAALSPRIWLEALEPRRLLSSGTAALGPDPTFGQAGIATAVFPLNIPFGANPDPQILVPAPGGEIYAVGSLAQGYPTGGQATAGTLGIARLGVNGAVDSTFGHAGIVIEEDVSDSVVIYSALVQPDGKLLVAADHTVYTSPVDEGGILLERFNPDGTRDQSFGTNGRYVVPRYTYSASTSVIDGAQAWLQPDGKIVVFYEQDLQFVKLRLNPDGTPDSSFGPGGEQTSGSILPPSLSYATAQFDGAKPLRDGGVVAYAVLDSFDYSTRVYTFQVMQYRLDAKANLLQTRVLAQASDPAFLGNPFYLQPEVDGSGLLTDGHQIARFGLDGTQDPTFGVNGAVSVSENTDVFLQTSGQILLVNDFNQELTIPGWLQRLNADGSADPTFADGQPAVGLQPLDTAALQLADGSILVATLPLDNSPDFVLTKILPDNGAFSSNNPPGQEPAGIPPALPTPQGPRSTNSANTAENLFASLPGASVFNPGGARKVFDDQSAL